MAHICHRLADVGLFAATASKSHEALESRSRQDYNQSVPWGLYRFHQSRLPHFITFTCYRRQSLLNPPEIRDAFSQILERTRARYNFLIYGFVVMPNHVHLLISEPQEGTIANVVQSLKIGSAKQIRLHAKGRQVAHI